MTEAVLYLAIAVTLMAAAITFSSIFVAYKIGKLIAIADYMADVFERIEAQNEEAAQEARI